MPFGRLFGKKDPAGAGAGETAAGTTADDAPESAESGIVAAGDEEDDAPELPPERTWRERAESVLPTGASTGSKRASALWGDDAPADAPTHFVSARGCHVIDVTGRRFIDCTMALGAVSLGYGEKRVTQAVVEAATEGAVAGLSSWREVELAERLSALIPCAERVQFLKTGAEAVSAAVRLARTYTGRDLVVACGYLGWHDWAGDTRGIPAGARGDTVRIVFDDMASLERAVADAGSRLAAVVLEPIVDREPTPEWLQRARALCDSAGAVLVFDEMKTGFRTAPGGYQELSGVTPDLATFGKAMANGYPLAAVVGTAPVMQAARETWISSTLAGESTALAAALAVLDWHEEADICATLAETGREMRASVERAIEASGVDGVRVGGVDTMWKLDWDDASGEAAFLRHAFEHGVMFKRGAYNYAAVAHDDEALRVIEAAASAAFVALAEESG